MCAVFLKSGVFSEESYKNSVSQSFISQLNQLTFNSMNFLGLDVKLLSFHVYLEITDDNMLSVLDTI